ncbi:MAG: FAD-dependent oxidoreductase [Sandaracinaceae bacterium]|nr:FAD-dependent oxidoreductase [Sandaracinaceae bacterium]
MLARTFAALFRAHAGPERKEALRISRRELLRGSLATGAGLMLGCGGASPPPTGGGSGPRVVVIGGGFAGLLCASELAQAGVEVKVLEARDRVGGRVRSLSEPAFGAAVEAGGELIGTNHPRWHALAAHFGLTLYELGEEEGDGPLQLGGRVLAASESEAVWEALNALTAQLDEAAAPVDAGQPWASPDAGALDGRSLESWLTEAGGTPDTVTLLRMMLVHDNAVAADRQSLLGLLAMIKGHGLASFWTDTETHRCAGGNQRLAEALASSLGDRLRLGAPVRAIDGGDGPMRITLASDEVLEADHVVVATPPSTWDRVTVSLPAWREVTSEGGPQMGAAVKALALLDRPRWRELGLTPEAMSDEVIGYTWDPIAGAPDATAPTLTPLTSFSGGPTASRLAELGRQGPAGLGAALDPLYEGISQNIREVRTLDWPNEEWTMAAYSFPAPGELTRVGAILRDGVGAISFAGEHCSPGFVGYMEGALESGARVAARIAGS